DANRTLLQAITSGSQDKNPAAWYYLARYYVAVSDPIGADSAFTKAEQLLPACKGDIAHWRRDIVWVPLYNAGVAALHGGKSDSAIYYFQRANAIYSAEPTGFKVLASLFFNSDQPDSAAKYFRLAATVAGTDPKWAQDRKESTFNLAASLQRGQHFDEAEAIYRDYLKTAPNDGLALVQLAQLYGSAGKADSAKAIFATIVQRADSLDANTTFAAGA